MLGPISAGCIRFERTNLPFAKRQIFGHSVQCFVFASPKFQKCLVSFSGKPVVSSEVHTAPRRVLKQSGFSMVRIAVKKGIPVTARTVDFLKTLLAARLDFELPQD